MSFGAIGASVAGAVASSVVSSAFSDDPSQPAQESAAAQIASNEKLAEQARQDRLPQIQGGQAASTRQQQMLGLNKPRVETREQIRARLSGGTGVNSSQQSVSQNRTPTSNLPVMGITDLGRAVTGNLSQFPQQYTDVYNSTNIGRQANTQQLQNDAQIRTALGLDPNDNSPEAQARVGAYRNTSGFQSDGNNNTHQISDNEIEAEYQRQLSEQQAYDADPHTNELERKFTLDDFHADPSYEFAKQEGQRALDQKASASGGYFSGSNLRAASQYNNDVANQQYGTVYDRWTQQRNNYWDMLQQLSATGQGSANSAGSLAQGYQGMNNSAMSGAANAQTNQAVVNNNRVNGFANQIGSQVGSAASKWLQPTPIQPTTYSYGGGNYDSNFINNGSSSYGDL